MYLRTRMILCCCLWLLLIWKSRQRLLLGGIYDLVSMDYGTSM
nr:MAG TPA: hypothetical protein [Caudoviricetes sp.]